MSNTPVALVTGAARRVGRAIAWRLAQGGYDLAITYHQSVSEAAELCSQIRHLGRRCLSIAADLTDPQPAVAAICAAVAGEMGRLDVLVNNASIYETGDLRSASVAQLRRMWAIHLEAPLLLCRALEPLLRSAGGQVINMVDLLAERPWKQYLGYCASKAALANLTLALAAELAPQVRVNGIAPGVAQWPEDYPPAEREKYLRRVPLGRAGTPQEVAELVGFLCEQGTYITGQIIRIDGGRSVS